MGNRQTKTTATTVQKTKIKEPRMYKVILLNDNFTTMEFVVSILESIFNKDATTAEQIMMNVHNNGEGVAGVYTYEIASTKVQEVTFAATQEGFPLRCRMERE